MPVVALTATASKETRSLIMKDLCMNEQTFQLVVDPNKENIKYWVFDTSYSRADICNDFDWLVELLREIQIRRISSTGCLIQAIPGQIFAMTLTGWLSY